MNQAILSLTIVLFLLMALIGGKRGINAFLSLVYNVIVFLILIIFIAFGFDPILCTIIGSLIISSILLFCTNGYNRKTVISCISVFIAILLTLAIAYPLGSSANIQGFSSEQLEHLSIATPLIHIDFSKLILCEILFGLLGAVIDVAISIASAMNELYENHKQIEQKQLLTSGMKIGTDILGTMTHTLLFAYIGGFFTLLIWFEVLEYPFSVIINSKIFAAEVFQILCGGLGIILVIPITAYLMTFILTKEKQASV